MINGIQVFIIITGTSVATFFPYLIFRSQRNFHFRTKGMKTLTYNAIVITLMLWWMNPNVQLQLSSTFWCVTVLSFALFYRGDSRIHGVPVLVITLLCAVLLYRITARIIPIEQMSMVLVACLLSGIIIALFLYGSIYPEHEELNPPGKRPWVVLIIALVSRLLWAGFQMIGGKTESRFGEPEPIHVFFESLDWWYLGVGVSLAILIPLTITIIQIIKRKDLNQSTLLIGATFCSLIIGQSMLLQFITQYGIVF